MTLKDDEGLPNLICAKCKRRVESLETAMMDLTKFKKEVSSCAAAFLASRRDGKRIKNTSSDFGVSRSPDDSQGKTTCQKDVLQALGFWAQHHH